MSQTGVRPREARIPVLIASRMRVGSVWSDVRIHNISSRGLMLASDALPPTGSYVEIRRGTQIIIGRVMWAKGRFFGVRSQEKLPVQSIIDEPRLNARPAVAKASGGATSDRRGTDRLAAEAKVARRLERSRRIASVLQFGVFVVAGLVIAGWLATYVHGLLSAPAVAIGRAVGGG